MGSFHDPADNDGTEELYKAFLTAHEASLRSAGVPECKWRTLCQKLSFSVFDAGDNFVFLQEEPSEDEDPAAENQLKVYTKCSMHHDDEEHIYLIDHAWTYILKNAKTMLQQNPALVERMAGIMELPTDMLSEELTKNILCKMWQFNNSYIVQDAQQAAVTCWYIQDEFGSRIQHSDEPTFQVMPFFFFGDSSMYSLLYPKSNVSEGEEVTVVFPGYRSSLSEEMKNAVKYPWIPYDFSEVDFNLCEPSVDYFASGRHKDIFPDIEWTPPLPKDFPESKITVYSELADVIEFLTHPSFQITDDENKANILWLSVRKYDLKELTEKLPNFCFISQFPSEHVLVNKDLLAVICRRNEAVALDSETLDSYPEWLPTTFNLKTELPKFISYFQNREKRDLDNLWICKPFNLARGMDIYISDNLSQIIRMSETRPMVACKYITDSVLFPSEGKGLVKMDLRYIVLLKSADPLEVYVYDRFWIRFANKPFSLEDFDDYERHFTVMNYVNFPLQQMFCHEFIKQFEDYYTDYEWSDIQKSINEMIKNIFVAATLKDAPAGLGKFSGSRAVYGLDIMLQWDRNHDVPQIKPVILEVNWMPDCKRACQYYPEFYNDVFSVLFLEDTTDKHVTLL